MPQSELAGAAADVAGVPDQMPDVDKIWRGELLEITVEQWRGITGTMGERKSWPRRASENANRNGGKTGSGNAGVLGITWIPPEQQTQKGMGGGSVQRPLARPLKHLRRRPLIFLLSPPGGDLLPSIVPRDQLRLLRREAFCGDAFFPSNSPICATVSFMTSACNLVCSRRSATE